jgi:hypothetical protein
MSEFSSAGSDEFTQVERNYEHTTAHQLRTARRKDGRMSLFVSALPYCEEMTSAAEITVSVLHNPSGHCASWRSGTPRLPDWVDELVSLYRSAKTARTSGMGTTARHDPRHVAQAMFIRAAMNVLGLGAAAEGTIRKLTTAAQAERARDVQGMAHLTYRPPSAW